jgi:hypothetical protein
MMRLAVFASLALLGACATPLPQIIVRNGDLFDVRYDAALQPLEQVNAAANEHCANGAAGYVSQETRFDGFAYRTYRCARR